MSAQRQLLTLGVALVFIVSAFPLFTASLPLYFADLGFDPTAIGLLIGVAAVAELFAAFGVGPSVDRFGGRALLLEGRQVNRTGHRGRDRGSWTTHATKFVTSFPGPAAPVAQRPPWTNPTDPSGRPT